MWRAPPSGSGCVIFTAMVLENNVRWYAEDGALTKTFCEMDSSEVEALDGEKCCACDEAKYSVSNVVIKLILFISIDSFLESSNCICRSIGLDFIGKKCCRRDANKYFISRKAIDGSLCAFGKEEFNDIRVFRVRRMISRGLENLETNS